MRTSGEVAVHFGKKEWGGLTKNGGSGTIRINEGGFALHLTYVEGLLRKLFEEIDNVGNLHLTYVEGLLLAQTAELYQTVILAPYLCRGIVTPSYFRSLP